MKNSAVRRVKKRRLKPRQRAQDSESGYVSSSFRCPVPSKPLPANAAACVTPGGRIGVIAYKLRLPHVPALEWKCVCHSVFR